MLKETFKTFYGNLQAKALDTFDTVINNSDDMTVIKAVWDLVQETRIPKFVGYSGVIISEEDMKKWRQEYLDTDDKIQIIKNIRASTGLGLKESKEFFDFHLFEFPMV